MKLSEIETRAADSVDKAKTKDQTKKLIEKITEYQRIMYAQSQYSLLIILQGMDASGKDGVVQSVFSGVNPLGCRVQAFKKPSEIEIAHDFLWRIHQHTPPKGNIQIFNRSHYEDILVPQVHQLLPEKSIKKRQELINHFEQLLLENNTHILKFYLHISQEEQHERLKERMTNPQKHWKHNDDDMKQSQKWDIYMNSYEGIFKNCSSPVAWNIIPSDQNWYKEFLVAQRIVDEFKKMDLKYPKMKKPVEKK